jgi:hypothetical protein
VRAILGYSEQPYLVSTEVNYVTCEDDLGNCEIGQALR